MKKIVIIGSPGAGKSTLAQELGRVLDIHVYHLDRYFWQPNWKEYPRQDRIEIEQQSILTNPQWIVEGSYFGSSDNRLRAADTIIFLDTPCLQCLYRVIARHIKWHGRTRIDLPDECTDRLDIIRLAKILYFPYKYRKWILTKGKELEQQAKNTSSEKTFKVLTSSKETKKFLKSLKQTCLEIEHNHAQKVPQYAHS